MRKCFKNFLDHLALNEILQIHFWIPLQEIYPYKKWNDKYTSDENEFDQNDVLN